MDPYTFEHLLAVCIVHSEFQSCLDIQRHMSSITLLSRPLYLSKSCSKCWNLVLVMKWHWYKATHWYLEFPPAWVHFSLYHWVMLRYEPIPAWTFFPTSLLVTYKLIIRSHCSLSSSIKWYHSAFFGSWLRLLQLGQASVWLTQILS